MRISATHSTVYRYDSPVYLEPHIVRLQPRMNRAQRLLAFDLQITPTPAGTTECLCAALTPYRKDAHVAESVKQYAKSVAARQHGQ